LGDAIYAGLAICDFCAPWSNHQRQVCVRKTMPKQLQSRRREQHVAKMVWAQEKYALHLRW
jgi:hypothetical protein